MEKVMHLLLMVVMLILVVAIFFGLIQTLRGPRRADRILGINMIGSLSLAAIAVVAVLLEESWLLDVCLVYCLISFLAVVVLSKIHILEKDDLKDEKKQNTDQKEEARYE